MENKSESLDDNNNMADCEEQPKNVGQDDGCSLENDPELNELLDSSLADFGKHVPKSETSPSMKEKKNEFASLFESMSAGLPGNGGTDDEQLMKEMEDVFGEEFAKQAETQLNEAMEMIKMDNPELLKQFEDLAKTVGKEETVPSPGLEEDVPHLNNEDTEHTLQSAVEDTLRRIQMSSEKRPSDVEGIEGLSSQLTDMMGNLEIGENGEGEEQVIKMMEGMMNTLLSKDVLYPSLVDFCKQYPEWLDRHNNSLSSEDKTRYTNQLQIMKTICEEFETDNGRQPDKDRQEKILKLMQELQQYGQPPEDLGGIPLPGAGGFDPSALFSNQSDNQCSLM